jgi:hypothetical protein
MYVGNLLKIIDIYEALDRGCPKHRGYRAKRKSQIECEKCLELYQLRQELKSLLEETGVEHND